MKFDVGIMNNQPVPAIVRQVQLAERLPGIGRIIILPQVPGQGFEEREEILTTFADEVMAKV